MHSPTDRPTGNDSPRTAKWVSRSIVPLAAIGNVGCYVLSLYLLDNGLPHAPAQTGAWQLVTVVSLITFQAVWLVWLRPQPVTTLLGSLLLWQAAVFVGGYEALTLQPGLLFAVFAFTTERSGWVRRILVAVGTVSTAVALTAAYALRPAPESPPWNTPAILIGWAVAALVTVGGAALAGTWYAALRDRSERIAELAQRVASGEAARTAEAVSAERRTLAQEIHDTSSAHLAAILALATAAQSSARDSDATQGRLIGQIRSEGERLYQGFERMLNSMLQEDRTITGSHQPGRPGQHRVTDIAELVAEHRAHTGASVRLHQSPALQEMDRRLGPMRAHIAFRVVQEALSNARKHAAEASIAIVLEDDGTTLLLRIENDQAPQSSSATVRSLSLGYGLEGMRDRLVTAGGSLRTGPRQNGGWSVNALLPHPPHQQADAAIRRAEREAIPPEPAAEPRTPVAEPRIPVAEPVEASGHPAHPPTSSETAARRPPATRAKRREAAASALREGVHS